MHGNAFRIVYEDNLLVFSLPLAIPGHTVSIVFDDVPDHIEPLRFSKP